MTASTYLGTSLAPRRLDPLVSYVAAAMDPPTNGKRKSSKEDLPVYYFTERLGTRSDRTIEDVDENRLIAQ